jgi:hypothetical protein
VERVMGIEPTRPAWKAGVLPLNYTRISATAISIAQQPRRCQPSKSKSYGFLLNYFK